MKWTFLIFLILFSAGTFAQVAGRNTDIHHQLVENKGQWPEGVLFQSKFPGGYLWVEEGRFLYQVQDRTDFIHDHAFNQKEQKGDGSKILESFITLDFLGVNKKAAIEKSEPSIASYSYFLGNKKEKWQSDVHGYSTVKRKNYYPQIDFVLTQEVDRLKYEFQVQPGGNPSLIQMRYNRAKSVKVNRNGDLVVETGLGQIIEEKPYVYQIVNGKFKTIQSAFELRENVVSFRLGQYDKSLPLIIDPILVFATYNGAVSDNFGMTATYGYDGTAYTGGMVFGSNYPFPDPNAVDSMKVGPTAQNGITDVFISKYNPTGTQMLWTCFLGGGTTTSGTETVHSLICDSNNVLYLYGVTSSLDFPYLNGYQSAHGGGVSVGFAQNGSDFSPNGTDLYVAKLSENGHDLLGATFFGGSLNDGINQNENTSSYDSLQFNYGDQFRGEIMLGPQREVIVASCTRSANFPTKNAYQNSLRGKQDGVIFSLSNDLSSLNFSTYFGGNQKDVVNSIKVDSNYRLVFGGGTSSLDLPGVAGKYQTTYGGGKVDGFIGKMELDGTFLGATYVGYSQFDQVYSVSIDRNSKVFVTGQSLGGQIPVINADYSVPMSAMFIMKFNEDLTVLEKSTSFGKPNSNLVISPTAFLVDRCGEIYVSGWGANLLNGSSIAGYPVTSDAFQSTANPNTDFYLIVIDRHFGELIYGSFIGGPNTGDHVDGGTSRFDQQGVVYQSICGSCGSGQDDFPTTPGAWSSTNNSSNCNNVVFKFDFQVSAKSSFDTDDTLVCAGTPIQLNNTSSATDDYFWTFGNGQTSTEFEPTLVYNSAGTYTIRLIVKDSVCQYYDTTELIIEVGPPLALDLPDSIYGCYEVDTLLKINSFGGADYFLWSSNAAFSDTLNNYPLDSTLLVPINTGDKYYVKIGNSVCSNTDSVVLFNKSKSQELVESITFCDDSVGVVNVVNNLPQLNFSYLWTPDSIISGSNTGNSVLIIANTSQYLYFQADDGMGCVLFDSIFVEVKNLADLQPVATANPQIVPIGGTSQLNVSGGGPLYTWMPNVGMSDNTLQNPSAKVKTETLFEVTVSDGYCQKKASVLVQTYEFLCDFPSVFIPNAFSPNGDGENDVLFVQSPLVDKMVLRIFNRWGEMVFESTDINKGWDGFYKGKRLDPDVFDYYLEIVCVDEQTNILKGNITLLR